MRSTITCQQMIDSGLNGFAVELLAESINGHKQKEKLRTPFSFIYKDVIFTLSLCPDREWTDEDLLKILEPIAKIEKPESFLIHFARAFVAADDEKRPFLAHLALMLIEKYSLWPYEPSQVEPEASSR